MIDGNKTRNSFILSFNYILIIVSYIAKMQLFQVVGITSLYR